jgi:hypothetical protein
LSLVNARVMIALSQLLRIVCRVRDTTDVAESNL